MNKKKEKNVSCPNKKKKNDLTIIIIIIDSLTGNLNKIYINNLLEDRSVEIDIAVFYACTMRCNSLKIISWRKTYIYMYTN